MAKIPIWDFPWLLIWSKCALISVLLSAPVDAEISYSPYSAYRHLCFHKKGAAVPSRLGFLAPSTLVQQLSRNRSPFAVDYLPTSMTKQSLFSLAPKTRSRRRCFAKSLNMAEHQAVTQIFCDQVVLGSAENLVVKSALITIRGAYIDEVLRRIS